jgi:citrate synthase
MAGWTAHVLEQYENNRLMRPESEYVGPPSAVYIPLEDRG